MRLTIYSGTPITDEVLRTISDIFAESRCPNESLINTLGDGVRYDGAGTVFLDDGDACVETVEVTPLEG